MLFTPRHAPTSSPMLLELCITHEAGTDPHSETGLADADADASVLALHQVGAHSLLHVSLEFFHDLI